MARFHFEQSERECGIINLAGTDRERQLLVVSELRLTVQRVSLRQLLAEERQENDAEQGIVRKSAWRPARRSREKV